MKFTKEDAYKDLVGKMTAKGEKLNLSERSINEQLETLIPLIANEETELSDFIEKSLPFFRTADANVRNDISVGINKYKADNTPQNTPPQKTNNTPDTKTELEERLAALEQQLANTKREKYLVDTRRDILSKLKDKGVKDEEWVNSLLSEITITDDFDVDTKVESFLNLYNRSQAKFEPNITPHNAGNGSTDYIGDAIKQASAIAKAQSLVGNE